MPHQARLEGAAGARGRFRATPSREDVRTSCGRAARCSSPPRTNPYKNEGDAQKVVDNLEEFGIDALVAIGGDDTLGVAKRLYEDFGVQVVGCPKTIDNHLSATDTTFGYDTAVNSHRGHR